MPDTSVVDIEHFRLQRLAPGESQQPLREHRRAAGAARGVVKCLHQRRGSSHRQIAPGALQIAEHDGQQIVEVVGDAGGRAGRPLPSWPTASGAPPSPFVPRCRAGWPAAPADGPRSYPRPGFRLRSSRRRACGWRSRWSRRRSPGCRSASRSGRGAAGRKSVRRRDWRTDTMPSSSTTMMPSAFFSTRNRISVWSSAARRNFRPCCSSCQPRNAAR